MRLPNVNVVLLAEELERRSVAEALAAVLGLVPEGATARVVWTDVAGAVAVAKAVAPTVAGVPVTRTAAAVVAPAAIAVEKAT